MSSHRTSGHGCGLRLGSPTAVSAPVGRHRPTPGRAVLACRCGTVLDLADLHRSPVPGPRIVPIRCRRCAAQR